MQVQFKGAGEYVVVGRTIKSTAASFKPVVGSDGGLTIQGKGGGMIIRRLD